MSAFSVNMDLNTVAGSKNSAGFPEKLPGFCAVLKGPDGSSCFLSGLFFYIVLYNGQSDILSGGTSVLAEAGCSFMQKR